jgi:hypothetical protein
MASSRDRLDFARRPFLDERPVWAVIVGAALLGVVLLLANARLWVGFHRDVAHVRQEIADLDARGRAAEKATAEAREALRSYRLSTLAVESRELLRLVAERRFSWTSLLARLERTLPGDVRLARLTPRFGESGEVGLDVGLVGRTPQTVVKTLAALSADPMFRDVVIKNEMNPEKGAPEGYSFELSVVFTPEDRP